MEFCFNRYSETWKLVLSPLWDFCHFSFTVGVGLLGRKSLKYSQWTCKLNRPTQLREKWTHWENQIKNVGSGFYHQVQHVLFSCYNSCFLVRLQCSSPFQMKNFLFIVWENFNLSNLNMLSNFIRENNIIIKLSVSEMRYHGNACRHSVAQLWQRQHHILVYLAKEEWPHQLMKGPCQHCLMWQAWALLQDPLAFHNKLQYVGILKVWLRDAIACNHNAAPYTKSLCHNGFVDGWFCYCRSWCVEKFLIICHFSIFKAYYFCLFWICVLAVALQAAFSQKR